jgi:hypothetical protein
METRSSPQNPKNKIKIWAVYNGPQVSGLKNSGEGKWTAGV